MSRRIAATLAVASTALALLASSASAASCPAQPTAQPFTSFGDNLSYFMVPGGNFETGAAGWTLKNAAVVNGNEPWHVGGSSDSHSMQINPGGSATSPVTCIQFDAPTMRFFARRASGTSLLSALRVNAIVRLPWGGSVTVPLTASAGQSGSWTLTSFIPTVVNKYAGFGTLQVQFQFVAPTTGTWQIDDVYVDPWRW